MSAGYTAKATRNAAGELTGLTEIKSATIGDALSFPLTALDGDHIVVGSTKQLGVLVHTALVAVATSLYTTNSWIPRRAA